jgi:hypothetical protein
MPFIITVSSVGSNVIALYTACRSYL